MKRYYTVIFLQPDWLAHTFGQDIEIHHVQALDPRSAVNIARMLTWRHNERFASTGDPEAADDWYLLAVFAGHHNNIADQVT